MEWMKELARDLAALGGVPFFLIVIARVALVGKGYYLAEFVTAGLIFLIGSFLLKVEIYSGLAFVVFVFTSLYYGVLDFFLLALAMYLLLIASLFYLGKNWKEILNGFLVGAIAVGAGLAAGNYFSVFN